VRDTSVNERVGRCMFVSGQQNARRNHKMKVANILKNVALINQNRLCEEIKTGINSGNICHNSVRNTLPSLLLSRSTKFVTYGIIIFLLSSMEMKLGLSHEGENVG
jgi:hypothetical protein